MEVFALVLSTFRDGSGNIRVGLGEARADWRQVERAVAAVWGGVTAESKAVMDIDLGPPGAMYGLSVKTSQRRSDDRVLLELNNSPARMLRHGEALGYARVRDDGQLEWNCEPADYGRTVFSAVKAWHLEAAWLGHDLGSSAYVVMTHDAAKNNFELFWWPLDIGVDSDFDWRVRGRAVVGEDASGIVRWEFYLGSGGQLKWYPDGSSARWRSGIFGLAPQDAIDLLGKAESMFPDLWPIGDEGMQAR